MEYRVPQLGTDGLIIEGIVTTFNADRSVNIAPMGPLVDTAFETLILRPFQTSTTYENLVRNRRGVFHVTDDVEVIAAAAVGKVNNAEFLADHPLILTDACRWYEFQIASLDDTQDRATMVARTSNSGSLREFVGFNRAKHAVVEAAILATRIGMLPQADIAAELARLSTIVNKTASVAEQRAFDLLQQYIDEFRSNESRAGLSAL